MTESTTTDNNETSSKRPVPVSDEIVTLDVGGSKFKAFRSILCRVKGSHLEAMFSGRFPNKPQGDGSYFVCRDGTHFRHVLNFLRVGAVVSLPKTHEEKEELAIEADYYGLDALAKVIRMPKVDIENDYLSDETRLIRKEEMALRRAFANHRAEGFDPHKGLVSIFCPDQELHSLPLMYNPEVEARTNSDWLYMKSVMNARLPGSSNATSHAASVKTLQEFETNINLEWPNLLERIKPVLLEEKLIVAGGAVLRALTRSQDIRTGGNAWGNTSDIDMFVYRSDAHEATRIARRIFYALAADHEKWVVVRSRGVINILRWTGHRWGAEVDTKIQVVLRTYESPTEVLIGFDVDCCGCAYDGRNVWLTQRCIAALESGFNILNALHAWPNKASYELRLAKYACRGFSVLVPGLDQRRIDYDGISRSSLIDLHGMARFIKVAHDLETASRHDLRHWYLQHRLEWDQHPRTVQQVGSLRESVVDCMTESEKLGAWLPEAYTQGERKVIVPHVYRRGGNALHPAWFLWCKSLAGDFIPISSTSRDDAWEEICDWPDDPLDGVAKRLIDAWDTRKRSREYLNDEMDKYDVDNVYYGQVSKES
jgi:hypothetical protein